MLQYASQWLKKSTAIMTLAIMILSATVQTVSAASGSTTPTTTLNPAVFNAVYGSNGAVNIISNQQAAPSTFKPTGGEQTSIHFDLSAPATVWLDILQNGVVKTRLFNAAGRHLLPGGFDTVWNGFDSVTNKTAVDGTYQFLITAKADSDATIYTAQNNVVVTSDQGLLPVVITTGNASPNPFNPDLQQQTYVSYTLNTQTNLNIEVVDGLNILTQLAPSPFTLNAGTYQVSWNGMVGSTKVAAKTYAIRFTGKNAATPIAYTTSVPVTVDYGTVNPPPANPKVLYVYADSASFDPNTSNERIHFGVDKSANAVVKILNSSNVVVRTYSSSSVTGGNDYFRDWDGRDDSNVLVSAGNYTAKVELSVNGIVVDSKQSSPFAVAFANQNNTAPVVTSVYANPSSFNPGNNETTTISYTLDKPATSAFVQILDSNNTIRRTMSGTGTSSSSTNTVSFNGRDDNGNLLSTGSYTVKVSATNANGTGIGTTFVTITNNGGNNNTAPVVTSVYANPSSFNPGNNETTIINYTLDKPATSAFVQILDSNNTIRRTMSGTGTSSSSTNTVSFNGRDDNGNLLSTGSYTVKVSATNANGTGTGTASLYINNSGNNNGNCSSTNGTPNLTGVYVSPSNFNPNNQSATIYFNVDRSANVTVEILNSNSTLMKTISDNVCRNSGSGTFTWDGRDMYGNMVNNGSYTVRVRANNGSGTDTEYTYLTVDNNGNNGGNNNGTLVLNMYVQPEIFNPRNGQTSTVYYNLNQTAVVTTQVLDRNGIVIRTLVDNVTRYSNNYAYTTAYGSYNYADQWNGRDVNGNIVPDNIYQFRVTANANGQIDSRTAWVEVDTDGIIMGFPNGSTCGNYIDVTSNSPYCKAIQLMTNLGVFSGYSDGSFRPYTPINRAETVKVILLALGIPVSDDGGTLFSDTDGNAWYAPFLRTAKRLGIIRGYPDGTFRPTQTVNRVELLKVFLESSGVNIPYCNYAPYNDTPVNADTRWYIDYVCYAKSNSLMHDDGAGRFSPAAAMTRGDVADLFYQFQTRNLYNQYNNPYVNGNYNYGYNNTNNTNNTSQNYTSTPRVSTVTVNPSNFNPNNGGTATISYTLDRAATTVSVQIMDSNGTVRRTLYNASTSATTNSISFNGRDDSNNILPSGTYSVRVSATNSYGTGFNVASLYLNTYGNSNSNVPMITSLYVNPSTFSPINGQTTTISYSLDRAATTVSVQIVDNNGFIRRTLYNASTSATANSISFNGRDDSNNILSAGTYTVRVNASNSYGMGTNTAYVYVQ